MGIDHALYLGSFSYGIKKSASLGDLDDFSIDGPARYRSMPRLKFPVEIFEEISESFYAVMALIYRQAESGLHKELTVSRDPRKYESRQPGHR